MSDAVWDIDVLFGAWPSRAIDISLERVRGILERGGVERGFALSTRGALFDDRDGNVETLASLRDDALLRAVGTVDLRDSLGADDELDRLREGGVRLLRLFPVQQDIEPRFPGFRHVVDRAIEERFVLLVEGDMRGLADAFRDRGARVVFLDLHAYHVGDFVLAARDEPGFHATTRLLNAPDSIERIVAEVGPGRLVYGSRTPLDYLSPSLERLRAARLQPDELEQIAWRNVSRMVEEAA